MRWELLLCAMVICRSFVVSVEVRCYVQRIWLIFFFKSTLTIPCHPYNPPLYFVLEQVDVSNSADGRLFRRNGRRPHKMDLLFYERSPNFCESNPRLDSPGTTGRYCNRTSSGVDNCDTLCCGRGYNTLKIKISERCNCKFYWCCYVECQVCTKSEWVTVCK